jgi:hypothetical protein
VRWTLAIALLGACSGAAEPNDAGELDATVKKDGTAPADALDESDASFDGLIDACGDSCCLKSGTICGNTIDAWGCGACCSDAWSGPIPKTIDYICAYSTD